MPSRRRFLAHAGGVSLAGLGAALGLSQQVQAADYKAVVVLFLSGGHDGNNMLVPTTAGAYSDYQRGRPALALARDSLVALPGSYMEHTLALAPSLSPLLPLFNQRRLAFIANAGPLIQPTTVAQVLDGTAKLPPFLYSHPEQTAVVQGWGGDADPSGWGGRAMDLIDPALKPRQPLVAKFGDATLVTAARTPMAQANSNQTSANWGPYDLENRNSDNTRRLEWMTRLQSTNPYEAEYVRSLRASFDDTVDFARGQRDGPAPAGNFADTPVGRDLRYLARHIPYAKAAGARRQIYLVPFGAFDTHANQLSMDAMNNPGLEPQFRQMADAMVAFDTSMRALAMDREVTMLVCSEFGRTLDPAAGPGSDHAWGNHWMLLGGAVKGGTVYGNRFPRLVNRGPDDAASWGRGVWLPQFATEQVAADLLLWLGLTPAQVLQAMPNLANFAVRQVGTL
jgi:uncharacterized protein (DUF1501 family)